jgi:hypothetical protein
MLYRLRLGKPTSDVWRGDMGTIHGFDRSVGAMLEHSLGAPNKWRSSRTTSFQAANPENFGCLGNVKSQFLSAEHNFNITFDLKFKHTYC